MPCSDAATITHELAAADAAIGRHELSVDADGKKISCVVEVTSTTQRNEGKCVGNAFAFVGPVMEQVVDRTSFPGMVGVSERPVKGRFAWSLQIFGAPANVRVVHTLGTRKILERAVPLTYREHRPNGDGCEPVCRAATAAMP